MAKGGADKRYVVIFEENVKEGQLLLRVARCLPT
jgi:hypothetical protein